MEYLMSSKKTVNSSQQGESEDDIEFVSESVLRPVLECIDLSNEEEFDISSEHYYNTLPDLIIDNNGKDNRFGS